MTQRGQPAATAAGTGGGGRLRAVLTAVAIGAVLALLLDLALAELGVFRDGPRRPAGSSYASGPTGLSSYADLLRRNAHPVTRRRTPLDVDRLDPATTVVVLDAPGLQSAEARVLRGFLDAGGRAVLGGRDPSAWLGTAVEDAPGWGPHGTACARAVVNTPETTGVRDVVMVATGEWRTSAGTLPVLACNGSISATVASPGAGRVTLLASSAPLTNQWLSTYDDAAFGLDVAGERGRPVVFAEAVHGFRAPSGLPALPRGALVALVGLGLAVALALLARARAPRAQTAGARVLAPSRLVLAQAVAGRLGRAKRSPGAPDPVQVAALEAVARRARLPANTSDVDLRAAASRLGLSTLDADALLRQGPSEADLLACAKVLATLSEEQTPAGRGSA